MKKLSLCVSVMMGFAILAVVAGCSKAPDANKDVAQNNEPSKIGGDTDANKSPDVNTPSTTSSGVTPKEGTMSPSKPDTALLDADAKPGAKPQVSSDVKKKPAKALATGGPAASGLVGKYKGEMKMPTIDAGDKRAQMAAQMAKTVAASLALELKSDKTFTLTMMFPLEGTYSSSGSILSLKVETMMGQTIEQLKAMAKNNPNAAGIDQMKKPMRFKIENGGKKLSAIPDGPHTDGSMTFTKL